VMMEDMDYAKVKSNVILKEEEEDCRRNRT
jgi:hypothetical protein